MQTWRKNHSQASAVHGSPTEIVARRADRSSPASAASPPARIAWRTIVGTTPTMVTPWRAATCHMRAGSGQSGVPSASTRVAPISAALITILGPTIQPMSLIHNSRSVGLRSMHNPMSSAFFTSTPQWVWMVPLGLPVVPEVYISIAGVSASNGSVGSSGGSGGRPDRQSTCRAPVSRRASSPRRSTTTVCTVPASGRARATVASSAIGRPRRQARSVVTTARAPLSARRSISGCTPKPENSGMAMAPILAMANRAAAASGTIGM